MKAAKLIFIIASLIGIVFLLAFFLGGVLFAPKSATVGNSSQGGNQQSGANGQQLTLDITEVAKHKTQSDCWMIIDNNVYDITSYFGSHPGGTGWLLDGCGIDATTLYNTKGTGQGAHSGNARQLLTNFFVGALNSQITSTQLQNKTTAIQNQTTRFRRYDNEYDD